MQRKQLPYDSKMGVLLEGPSLGTWGGLGPHAAPLFQHSALVMRCALPPQFDFTSYQGVLFVMLMVLFFGGIILAVILPYQYVSNYLHPSFLAPCHQSWSKTGS